VATRFGSSPECIEPGRTGFLCDTDDDWVEALSRLRDPSRRATIGAAARRVVEERYASTVAAAAFARVLEAARDHFCRRA